MKTITINQVEEIKGRKLKKEELLFITLISKMDFFIIKEFPKNIFWTINGEIIMDIDSEKKIMWVKNNGFWMVFSLYFFYNYKKTETFIKDMMKICFDIDCYPRPLLNPSTFLTHTNWEYILTLKK